MMTSKPHCENSCYLGSLRDGDITVHQSAVTTKQSILLSEILNIHIGFELSSIIKAL